ncbi:hypothetical protein FM037_02495 [Shewanella psychropiezotolerans]|uniref:Uncharacterized protein n=1 Tax=Shewanella psychropiezotolerans TaxID=2593655 RepID=A0ABX5WT89_9GAMM|nr:hypothetical protein [Shewanella psychropiezotolerans]QDO82314.1 hypothetical protein FM037_02495 [Shewanella psychropiezotolerans]
MIKNAQGVYTKLNRDGCDNLKMIFILKILIIFGLAKLLEQNEKPFLYAGIYTSIFLVLSLLFGAGFVGSLIGATISFVFAAIYFCLLDRFMNDVWYWPIFAIGILVGFV